MGREWKSDGRGGTITEGVDQAAVKRPPDILKKAIPDGTVVLTFDDALRHHYTKVAPALEERGFGGTFYVSELYFPVYGADDYADGVKKGVYMTWEEIADLERRGFEIGNHSLRHANLPGMTQAEMKREIDGIAERCAAYRIPRPQTFAYPARLYCGQCGVSAGPRVYLCQNWFGGGLRSVDAASPQGDGDGRFPGLRGIRGAGGTGEGGENCGAALPRRSGRGRFRQNHGLSEEERVSGAVYEATGGLHRSGEGGGIF